jgi:hypothetical protein
MSTHEVFVQQFTRLFEHYEDALSPEAAGGKQDQPASWNLLPAGERNRLVAAARLAILELESSAGPQDDSRKYYAKPGEAEWGC